MKKNLRLLLILVAIPFSVIAQTRIEKVEPPSWWTDSTVSSVRILLTGKNLNMVKQMIGTSSPNLKTSSRRASENGDYLFFDLEISPKTKPGKYKITVSNVGTFDFEIFPKSVSTTKHRGYTPDDVIYFVIPDRFTDGDPSNNDPEKSKGLFDRRFGRHYHGGDIQGLINRLPYLKSLGVTAIWTTPFYDNNDKPDYKEMYEGLPFTTGYHGYGATDMYAVDEHLGDMAKLKEFVSKAQAMGFKIIQDQVANHVSPYHSWAENPPTPTWWNGTVADHPNNNWQKWTAMNPRATYQTQSSNIDGWFINILPDFNQDDKEVEKYLIQNSLWWLQIGGFDAIRMDTLPHVPRSFWQKWGSAIKKEYPKVNILGELFDNDPVLISYFQKGRKGHDGIDTHIDTLYDFGLFYPIRNAFAKGESIRQVSQMLSRDWIYPNPNVLTTFLGVHDMERFMHEKGATTEGLKLAQTFIMTTRGTPLLYYGDEIAMPGGGDPDNRRDFPGGFAGDGINAFDASGRTKEQNDVWNHLAKLGAIRKQYPALRTGKSLDLLDNEQQLAYVRVLNNEAVLMAFNNDTKPAEVTFDVGIIKEIQLNATLKDLLGKVSDIKVDNGKATLMIPARTAGIFTAK